MNNNDTLFAKAALQEPKPAIERLRTVGNINSLHRQLATGGLAASSSPSMTTNREYQQ